MNGDQGEQRALNFGELHPWQQVKLAVLSSAFGIKALEELDLLRRLEQLCIEGVRIGVLAQRDGKALRQFADPDADWPVFRVKVNAEGVITESTPYAPGLPEGEHDLWCMPVQQALPKVVQPLKARTGTLAAIERLRHVDREILEDIEAALRSATEDHHSPDLDELDCTLLLELLWLWRHAQPAMLAAPVVHGMADTAARLDHTINWLRENRATGQCASLGDFIALRALLKALEGVA